MKDICDVLKTTIQQEECSVLIALLMLLEDKNSDKEVEEDEYVCIL